MASLERKTAEQISKRPRYIETVGEACPLSVTRITREPVEGEVRESGLRVLTQVHRPAHRRWICANGENLESRRAFLIA